jgi:hypothetical protein
MKVEAVCCRRQQFCAGPGTYVFHACSEHRVLLDTPGAAGNGCFLRITSEPIRDIEPDEMVHCDFCFDGDDIPEREPGW